MHLLLKTIFFPAICIFICTVNKGIFLLCTVLAEGNLKKKEAEIHVLQGSDRVKYFSECGFLTPQSGKTLQTTLCVDTSCFKHGTSWDVPLGTAS